MMGIVLAVFATAFISLGQILIKKKLNESDAFNATLVNAIISNLLLWPLVPLFVNLRTLNLEGVLLFIVAGIVGHGFGRLLYYKSMAALGVSVSSILFSINPIFTALLAVLLLNETLSLINGVGIICIVSGVMFIERSLTINGSKTRQRVPRKILLFPVLVASAVAFAQICRKQGLNAYNEPLLGVAIGHAFALVFLLTLLSFSHNMQRFSPSKREFRFFWKAGVLSSLGSFLALSALSYERVSVVTPITSTEPLFVVFFTYLYLKELERVSPKLIASAMIIVVGAILVSM